MAQTQTTKQATKPATKQAARKQAAKGSKPASKKTSAPAATSTKAAPSIKYGIHTGYRPGAGRLLFAFTHAWLTASGLLSGKSIPRADASRIAGGTAISYHVAQGNMVDNAGALSLTAAGISKFSARNADQKAADAFIACLSTGKPDDSVGIKRADVLFPLTKA